MVGEIAEQEPGHDARESAEAGERAGDLRRAVDAAVQVLHEDRDEGCVERTGEHDQAHDQKDGQVERELRGLGTERAEHAAHAGGFSGRRRVVFAGEEEDRDERQDEAEGGGDERQAVSGQFGHVAARERPGDGAGEHGAVQRAERESGVFARGLRGDERLRGGHGAAERALDDAERDELKGSLRHADEPDRHRAADIGAQKHLAASVAVAERTPDGREEHHGERAGGAEGGDPVGELGLVRDAHVLLHEVGDERQAEGEADGGQELRGPDHAEMAFPGLREIRCVSAREADGYGGGFRRLCLTLRHDRRPRRIRHGLRLRPLRTP